MIAMTGIALLGTAGAFNYREIFGGSVLPTPPPIITTSNEPNKIAPASSEPKAKNSGNAGQGDEVTTGSIEQLIPREEQPPIDPSKAALRSWLRPCRRAAYCRSGSAETSVAARSGGCGSSGASSSQCRCVAAHWPIGCSGRHSCSEPRAFGCRPRRTCRSEQRGGSNPSCLRQWLCGSNYVGAQ